MMWSTVSNAADKPSNQSIVTCPRSTAISKKEIILRTSLLEVWYDDGVALTERKTSLFERRIAHIDNERKDLWKVDLVGVAEIIFRISSAEYGSKLSKTAGDDGRLDSAGIPSVACRTDATLLLKKLRRSSAVDWFGH